jgi:hypothetical protein
MRERSCIVVNIHHFFVSSETKIVVIVFAFPVDLFFEK